MFAGGCLLLSLLHTLHPVCDGLGSLPETLCTHELQRLRAKQVQLLPAGFEKKAVLHGSRIG